MTPPATSVETCRGTGHGKLMIAGEYAVTRPLRRAIVAAVDRRVTATVAAGRNPSVTVTTRGGRYRIGVGDLADYARLKNVVSAENSYALRTIAKAAALARATGAPAFEGAEIEITSDLDEPAAGVKYGLGGSSAVTVALAVALNQFLGLGLDREGLWKLGYLATLETNPYASGADLAAALYGGWLCYRSPDRDWLGHGLAHRDLADVVHDDWPGLEIRAITRPPGATPVVVGWSGSAAVTAHLVATARSRLTAGFLDRSDDAVNRLATALSNDDESATAQLVGRAQALLEELDTPALGIVTDRLRAMVSKSADLGVPCKVSGAGGGDCCIAFPSGARQHAALTERWTEAGFAILPLRTGGWDGH